MQDRNLKATRVGQGIKATTAETRAASRAPENGPGVWTFCLWFCMHVKSYSQYSQMAENRASGDWGITCLHHCHLTEKEIFFFLRKIPGAYSNWHTLGQRNTVVGSTQKLMAEIEEELFPLRKRDTILNRRGKCAKQQSVWQLCITINSFLGILQTLSLYLQAYKNFLLMFYTNNNILWQVPFRSSSKKKMFSH